MTLTTAVVMSVCRLVFGTNTKPILALVVVTNLTLVVILVAMVFSLVFLVLMSLIVLGVQQDLVPVGIQ